MKRSPIFLMLLLLACTLLNSCLFHTDPGCEKLMNDLVALYPDIPATESLFISGKTDGNAGFLGETDAAFIYTGTYGTLAEWELFDSFAIRLPDRPQVYEIHIIKVKNESDADTVCKMMCRRADLLHKYFLSQNETGDYDYSNYEAEVYVSGNYVFLLATPDNEQARKCIEKRL